MLHISARELALKVLRAVEEEGAFANIALNRVLEKYRPEKLERAFATELAYGTLRSLNTLDWILGHFVKKPCSPSHGGAKHPQAGCVSAAVYGKVPLQPPATKERNWRKGTVTRAL